MPDDFVVGDAYFIFHFLDNEFKFPVVTSVVFLGKNLEASGSKDDLWFFQDAESYVRRGPYSGVYAEAIGAPEGERDLIGRIYDFPESQLPGILTVEGLIAELSELK